jgi:hypothetical protein
MMKRFWILFCFVINLTSGFSQNKTIDFNNNNLVYEGRVLYTSDAAVLAWSGNSVTLQFEGTSISAILKDLDTANYYNIIVDGNYYSKIHTDTIKHSYLLASGLTQAKHSVQLFKRTEWDKGKTLFYGFEIPENEKILPPAEPKKRKIEFFGNSITSGYANEDNSGRDSWKGYFQNNYLTYAALTARHFNAQYSCISKSGIGIMLSWFPFVMQDIYDLTDPKDPSSKWDFSKYTPDVVVINLYQNDSWLVNRPERNEFRKKFGATPPDEIYIENAYKDFVSQIRNKYPKASIICALGSMDATREGSPWPGYITKAVEDLHDTKIYTHFFKYKGKPGHPNIKEHQEMANSLIDFIEKNIVW